jgi:hypothetical protein
LVHASVALLAPFACFYLVELNWGRKRAIQVAIWLGVALATLTFWVPSSGFFGLHLKPRDWIESLRLIPQFVGGTTAYREFAGEPTREFRAAVDLSVATLLFAVIGLGVRRAWRHRGPFKGDFTAVSSPALALGINFVAIILFLGPTPFRLEFERYALPLLVPLLMVLVQAIRTQFGKRSELLLWGAGLASVMSFAVGYFHPASPPAAWAYRTESGRESKTRLAQDVLRRCATGGVVITEDWWTYWPFRFLLSQSPQIRVLHEGGDSGLPVRDLVNRSDRRSSEGRWPCGLRVSRVRPGLAGGAIAHTVLSDGFGVEFLNAEGWPSPPEAQTQ